MLPLWDSVPHRRPPVTTALLIAANLAVLAYQLFLLAKGGSVLDRFMIEHALVPGRLIEHWQDRREWQTLLSHMFLHGGVLHLVGNCWFLWIFGNNVEDRLGPFRYLCFYVLAGLAAAALQILIDPGARVPMVGASGAISGVLGAYFVMFPRAWVVTLVPWIVPIMPVPAFLFLILWFVVQAFNGVGVLMNGSGGGGGVAWWAHAGGFAAGVGLALWAKSRRWVRSR